MDQATFVKWFNPSYSTLGMAFKYCFDGGGMLALAAEQLKAQGKKSINTVFIVPASIIGAQFRQVNGKWLVH